jgi:hypothetical protein
VRQVRVPTPSPDGRGVTNYVHMTALAVRHETGTRGRFDRSESRMAIMEQLRERIARDDYAVDPAKVADAIVRRLMLEAAPDRG